MRQVLVRNVAQSLRTIGHQWNRTSVRSLATVKDIFPNKVDFPSRHIGPRKTDVVEMLDLLGYKVGFQLYLCDFGRSSMISEF